MEPIQICVLNDEQTEKQEFGLGISVSEKNRIGVLINRKCSMIQYFIGDVLAGGMNLFRHLLELVNTTHFSRLPGHPNSATLLRRSLLMEFLSLCHPGDQNPTPTHSSSNSLSNY